MKQLICLLLPVLTGARLLAQYTTVLTGTVVDSSNQQPVSNVSVHAQVSHATTITDAEGHFQIHIKGNSDTMSFSHVNFKPQRLEINASSASPVKIYLQKNTGILRDVIVSTGYQNIPKERSAGSFTQIDNQALNLQPGTFILNRLNGITNGVIFPVGKTNTPALLVRGMSSITGSKEPLIVVDNFPYEGDIQNINPNDVSSVTVLKDAAAASIWGTKAGNGVIVITTKKGAYNQKPSIEVNTNITILKQPDLNYMPQMNSDDYINVEQMLFDKGVYNDYDDLYPLFGYYPAISPVAEILLSERKGDISHSAAEAAIDEYRKSDVRDDYRKYFYQNGFNQQYAINVNGGSRNINYIFSLGYDYNKDVLGADYKRISLKFANNYQITPKLELSINTLFTNSKNVSGKPAYNTVLVYGSAVPYLKFADINGQAVAVAKDYRQTYTDTAGNGQLLNWKYYPLEDYKHNTNKTSTYNVFTDVGLRYEMLRGLKLDVKLHYEMNNAVTNNLQDEDSYAARSLINYFTQVDPDNGGLYYPVPKGGILNTSASTMQSYDLRGQLNYNYSKNKHALYAIAGVELRATQTKINNNTLYGYNGDVLTVGNVDFVNPYPSYVDGSASYITNGLSLSELTDRYVSFFGNAAYTYHNKYTITASARRDASNMFGVNTNDKWKPLWSAGAAWDFSKEPFYKWGLLPEAKFRATYGYSGNADQTRSAVTTFYLANNAPFSNLPYALVNRYANPDLRWEKIRTINLGIDFGLKEEIVTGSIEYYIKNGTDLLGAAPLDYTSGLGTSILVTNNAATRGNGVEISVNTKNVDKVFKWQTGFIFNFYRDKITKLYNANTEANAFVRDGTLIANITGKPLYSVLSYKWRDLDPATGDPQGIYDGKISKDYNAIINNASGISSLDYNGPALPVYWGALTNTFKWKSWSLTANITYQLGYFYRKSSINYSDLFATGNGHADYALRWQKPGDEKYTQVPSMQYPADPYRDIFYLNSSATVYNAGNIRLQFIKVDYHLTKSGNKKLPFQEIQFYAIASNLGILWKASKGRLDPDYVTSLPPLKTLTLGITARL